MRRECRTRIGEMPDWCFEMELKSPLRFPKFMAGFIFLEAGHIRMRHRMRTHRVSVPLKCLHLFVTHHHRRLARHLGLKLLLDASHKNVLSSTAELATNITTAQEGCFPFHGTIKPPACTGGIFPVSELCASEGKAQPAGPWLPSVLYTVDSDVKRRWHPGLVQDRHRDLIVIGVPIVKGDHDRTMGKVAAAEIFDRFVQTDGMKIPCQ